MPIVVPGWPGRQRQGRLQPSIGHGLREITYADGRTKDFYQVGISANTEGISVYIFGIDDKAYLAKTYSQALGKARVTGVCIKFKTLDDIDIDVLLAAIRDGVQQSSCSG